MSQSASVESLDAVKEFKAALVTFGADALDALAAAEVAVQRVLDDLNQQLRYWQTEVRRRQEELTRAKSALVQRRWGHTEGKGPGSTDAELAVKHAQQRLREAEDKVETVKRWLLQLPREIGEYQGPARRLAGFLEADLKQGVVQLDRRIGALEAYLTPAAPPTAETKGEP